MKINYSVEKPFTLKGVTYVVGDRISEETLGEFKQYYLNRGRIVLEVSKKDKKHKPGDVLRIQPITPPESVEK